MDREKFVDTCGSVRGFFDYLKDDDYSTKLPPISRLIHGDNSFDPYSDIQSVIDDEDKVNDLIWNIRDMAFSIGFILGSEIEVTNLEARADIKAIRKEIRDKALLPYLLREKRT